jgi:hypothetical protein
MTGAVLIRGAAFRAQRYPHSPYTLKKPCPRSSVSAPARGAARGLEWQPVPDTDAESMSDACGAAFKPYAAPAPVSLE